MGADGSGTTVALCRTGDVGGRLGTPGIRAPPGEKAGEGEAGTGLGHRHVGSDLQLRRKWTAQVHLSTKARYRPLDEVLLYA